MVYHQLIKFAAIILFLLISPICRADELSDAKSLLHEQLNLISKIKVYTELEDQSRLAILTRATNNVLRSIDENGFVHVHMILIKINPK